MISLVLSDLRANVRVWVGILLVAAAAGFAAAIGAGLLETANAHEGPTRQSLQNASSPVLIFSGFTALVVLSSTANLTVSVQRRSYALWQILNIRPLFVALVVEVQLAVVAALGAIVGVILSGVTFQRIFDFLFATWNFSVPVEPKANVSTLVLVVVGIVGVVVISGLRSARKAALTSPLQVLTEPEPPQVRMTWVRYLLTVLAVAATYGLVSMMADGDVQTVTSTSILVAPAIVMVFATAGPLLLPLALRAWTWIVPARASTAWYLARHTARYRVTQSAATISPLMVGIGLSGGIYTCIAILAEYVQQQSGDASGYVLEPGQAVQLLGGPLLIAGIGAAVTVFMSGGARQREVALLQAAGSSPRQIIGAAILEAIIYTFTAALLAFIAVMITAVIVSSSLGMSLTGIHYPSILIVTAFGFVLILTASLSPTFAALCRDVTRTLASV